MSPAKVKNRRDIKFWKIRMQKQINSWRNELSIIAETATGSDNGNLTILKNIAQQRLGNLYNRQKH